VTVKKPSQPWKVVFLTDATPLPEKKFRSERAAYQAVNGERELIKEGTSRVKRAVVYQWQNGSGRWMVFDRHNLKEEAEQQLAADKLANSIVDEALEKGDEK